jgi:YesN/AraC family two-component response regulator
MSDNPLEQFLKKNNERADKYHRIIEEMMSAYAEFHYAQDTLLGIMEYIEKNGSVTDAQVKAVENIRNNPTRNGR